MRTGADFWNRSFSDLLHRRAVQKPAPVWPFERCFREMIGEVRNQDVLEIGCGLGADTIRYAAAGARVTAIDISPVAVAHVRQILDEAGLDADLRVMDALDLRHLDRRFDLIAGRFILHHLEPFAEISRMLAGLLRPDGRLVFAENNARNPWLMLARTYLAGHYGIPKHGDELEHPFTPAEAAILGQDFISVTCHFPEMVFLRKLNTYIFRHKRIFRPITATLDQLDDALWRAAPALRPWSYNQIVAASGPRH
jgi:2-polyprenyl-3-methyl-5-hydroxy-6-metoxy-1,4-benzoquinol methylase